MAGSSYDVIVVGGGFAGVAATRNLREAGRSVLLLEARDRLGGRTWTRPFGGTDQRVELGGTWVAPQYHPHVAREIERYDLRLAESHPGPVRFLWSFDRAFSSAFPVTMEEIFDLERALVSIIDASRRIDYDRPRDEQGLADLDVSVAEYLDGLGLGRSARRFLEGWAALGSGARPEEWSMLAAASWVAAMENSVWGWYAAVVEKFADGTGGVIARMVDEAQADVELGTVVTAIEQDADAVRVVTRDGRELHAGAAVIATPVATWKDIAFSPALSEAKRAATERSHPGRMTKLWLRVEGAPTDTIGFGLDADLLWLSSEYELPDGSQLMVAFSAPQNEFEPDGEERVAAALREYAPDAKLLAHDWHDWAHDPHSQGTWMVPRPGHLSTVARQLQEPEGRLHFAGADIANRWIGWIDGAIESAARACREVLQPVAHA